VLLRLHDGLKVTQSSALMGDQKALLRVLLPDRPVLDREPVHREFLRVAGGEYRSMDERAWIGAHLAPVDRVLCSTAERTRQTLAETGVAAPISYLDRIYAAEPEELLDLLRDLGDEERTVLLVGHAPGLPYLAMDLAGSDSDEAALDRLHAGFPTSAVAVLAVTGDWSEIGSGRCTLVDVVIPR